MSNLIKGTVSINRLSGLSEPTIQITVTDEDARVEFLQLRMTLDAFARCVTGQSMIECNLKVRGLKNVGKVYEQRPLEFQLKQRNYGNNRKSNAIKKADHLTPDGWTASHYFGSQNSFFTKNGENWARTYMYRWVDK